MTNEQFDNARAALRVALADYKAAPEATLVQWRAQARLEAACTPELLERLLNLVPLQVSEALEQVLECAENGCGCSAGKDAVKVLRGVMA